MEARTILASLNEAQQEAVSAPLGHHLVLAGAGTGRTRVLIHRIACLLSENNLSPFNILAATFTNKAAAEMRSRLQSMLNIPARTMWIGTFHGLSHRFLRAHWQEARLPQSFQILDSDDQHRLVKRVIRGMNLDENRFPPKEAQWFINHQKEQGLEPQFVPSDDHKNDIYIKIYIAYEEACARAGVIDFADLLLKTNTLLLSNAELRQHYRQRFQYLLVDEFQDTNQIQYQWLKTLAGAQNSVMIVGDDDQSIYGWRGAQIENLHRFSIDYPGAEIIRLEQNYRSTATILNAANALISKNTNRVDGGKTLRTDGKQGEPITVYSAFNETDEAFFIVNRIREFKQNHYRYLDMAILYRSNAQSRVLEEALMQFGIPYRVYGGLRYFDRAEIKDALAYLRILANKGDDPAFERIINTPTRGIGDRTLSIIRETARNQQLTLWDALHSLIARKEFNARTENALLVFTGLIKNIEAATVDRPLKAQVEHMLKHSGLIEHYRKEKGEKGLTRVENLEELINAAYQFSQEGVDDEMPPLAAFLAYAALESGEEGKPVDDNCVQLMTLHSAKGLEFPIVFLAGCEEELFPHYLCMQDPKALEEERRLCYVGITRAMHKLFLSYAELRRMHGKEAYHQPSRFINEIPLEFLAEIKFRTKVSKPTAFKTYQPQSEGAFKIGQKVSHRVFGKGTVIALTGDGEDMKVGVKFSSVGTKTLIASYLTADA